MSSLVASLLYSIVAALGRVPWSWLTRAANRIAGLWRRLDARESRVARRDLELA